MYINHDDLAAMATSGAGVLMLKALNREQDALQRQVSSSLSLLKPIKLKQKKNTYIQPVCPSYSNHAHLVFFAFVSSFLSLLHVVHLSYFIVVR